MPEMEDQHSNWPPRLLVVYVLVWMALAIAPKYRADWVLENVLVVITMPLLVWGYRRLRFTVLSYAGLWLFLLLHAVGSHYTYAEVPVDAWSQALFGASINDWLGFERNHFDRLVHFGFGLLLLPLAIELLAIKVHASAATMRLLAVVLVLACSALYELIEWVAALVFGGELGMAYLGTQGDEWDSHKDTALALAGAIVTAVVLAILRIDPRSARVDGQPAS